MEPIRGNEDCMKINKISAKMVKGCDAEAACRELGEYYDIIRHESNSGIAGTTIELVPKGFNKAVGIAESVNSLISHGKIRSYSETAIMIWRCLNTQL